MADIFGDADDGADAQEESGDGQAQGEATAEDGVDAPAPVPGSRPLDKLDMRLRIITSAYYDVAGVEERGFGRQENRLEYFLKYQPNDHIQLVGDIEAVFFGVSQAQYLDDLATQRLLTPFHLESDAAYVALLDIAPGLDIKIGRQTLVWGTADRFNPTNNINPDDLEDRPLFTEPIGNQMVVVDYAPLADRLWFQGVYVPIFFPALLPPSASAALKDPFSPVPFVNQADLDAIGLLQQRLLANENLIPHVNGHVINPKLSFANGQAAAKVGTHFAGMDWSASYYYGRHDIPTATNVESFQVRPTDPREYENPDESLGAGCCFVSDVFMEYPRMQVVGLDMSTQVPFMANMGLWGEAGLFIPEAKTLRIEFPVPIDITPDDPETGLVTEMEGRTIKSTPFVKVTTGVDHTFGKHVYVQAQYLRGFIDDFGVGHIGNYLVAGTDLIFFGRHLIFRLFGVVDFPTGRNDPGSYVVFPELIGVLPWGGVTLELGSFFMFSDMDVNPGKYSDRLVDDTKFGQAAAGSSIVFFKATGTF